MDTKIELLRQVPLFEGSSREELRQIASLVDEIDVAAGTILVREGANPYEFIVILDGEVGVDEGGVHVATLRGGDFLGEIAVLTRGKRTAPATTTAPSRLLVLTDRAFRRLTDTMPAVASRAWAATAARMPG